MVYMHTNVYAYIYSANFLYTYLCLFGLLDIISINIKIDICLSVHIRDLSIYWSFSLSICLLYLSINICLSQSPFVGPLFYLSRSFHIDLSFCFFIFSFQRTLRIGKLGNVPSYDFILNEQIFPREAVGPIYTNEIFSTLGLIRSDRN